MNLSDKNIIEMSASDAEEGGFRYVPKRPRRPRGGVSGWVVKILGIALGVAIFLLLIFFFVYVIVPLVLVLILYSLLRNIFKPYR